ncbi:unnamed protein product [Mycena citricolor]|uniref:Uncharacterized protein n=1 Tax=Mycena citricolor TaxID=2018698 RepID=A0AAD2HJV8_9AGAR|nr:unnamed protein product [Mycena citricolor]
MHSHHTSCGKCQNGRGLNGGRCTMLRGAGQRPQHRYALACYPYRRTSRWSQSLSKPTWRVAGVPVHRFRSWLGSRPCLSSRCLPKSDNKPTAAPFLP